MSPTTALTTEQGLSHLTSIVGQEHAHLSGTTLLVAPGDAQQIAEVVHFAQTSGLAVVPTGGGTKLDWGNPVAFDIRLSMARMHALHEHAWQDMTCTVQAGLTWTAMQNELARHGQMVALDPLWPDQATVGGIVATNDSGALRLKYGGLRDLILGMTIVLADGTIAKTGGKVVKNVAGYDLHKLMTGSFGTLAVIAQVNFRLHPIEKHARTWTAVAQNADPTTFADPLRALMDSQLSLSSVQIRASRHESALDIRIAAVPACLDEYGARIKDFFAGFAITVVNEGVWNARQQLFNANDAVILKLSVLPTEVCAVTRELLQTANATLVAYANGLVTVALDSASGAATTWVEHLRTRASRSGGSVVALRIPDALRGKVDVWGPGSDALPLMQEIKRRFDPGRTLNPGRCWGNL